MSTQHAALREQLLHALRGDQSHIVFEHVVEDFPPKSVGVKPHGAPHNAWQLLEHMRMAQHDILEFSRNAKHESPKWPEGYWPTSEAPPDDKAWQASITAFREDATAMAELIRKAETEDLHATIEGAEPHYTLLREALVLATHNSYHLGQLMFLKRMLSA